MFKFDKKDLLDYATVKDIFKYTNSYDLFRHYIGDFKIGKPFLSPLRPEKEPSFSIFLGSKGDILFNDFVLGVGDIMNFLMIRDNLTLREAICKIVQDSDLSDKFRSDLTYMPKTNVFKHDKIIMDTKTVISVKRRVWSVRDTQFWSQYHITKDVLRKYKVAALSYIFYNGKPIKAETYSYCFLEMKDNIESFTIYQPYSKERKWNKSHDSSVFYGWRQLPEKGDKLIITKSLKDVMTIDTLTGIPTVALQNEKIKPKPQVIAELKRRFKKIYLLYDNDFGNEEKGKTNYGRTFGKNIVKEFDLIQIEIPDRLANKYKAKDISDLAKYSGKGYVVDILINNIKDYII